MKWVLSEVLLSVLPIGRLHYNLWEFLLGVGSVCDSLWVIVVGYHPPYNAGAGESPVLGGVMYFWLVALVSERMLVVPPNF